MSGDILGPMTFTPETVVRAGDRQVSARLGNEAVVLGLASGGYFGLEEVGLHVWERLAEPVTVSALRDSIVADYDVDPDRCYRDPCGLLAELEAKDLIKRVSTD